MINISGFKEKERYRYLIAKLLSYKAEFNGKNISEPDIIELIEISKDQEIIKNLFDLLTKYNSQKKGKFSIKVFNAINTIVLNYLDLLDDLLTYNKEINFHIFISLPNLMTFFYTIKDNVLITLNDIVKDHKLLKNQNFWHKYFLFVKEQKGGQLDENYKNFLAINDCLVQMSFCGFKEEEIKLFFKNINIDLEKLDEKMQESINESFDNNEKLMKKNQDINYIRLIIWKLFSPILSKKGIIEGNLSITNDELTKLYKLLNDKNKGEERFEYMLLIFQFLNNNRLQLKELDKKRFDVVNNLFKISMDYVLTNEDKKTDNELKQFFYIINILSDSFYFNNNGSHIFISGQEQFKNHGLLQQSKYWEIFFYSLLDNEEKNYSFEKLKPILITFLNSVWKYVNNEELILSVINSQIKRWNITISKEHIDEIKELLNMK